MSAPIRARRQWLGHGPGESRPVSAKLRWNRGVGGEANGRPAGGAVSASTLFSWRTQIYI
jgi:hypothetical protein